MRHILPVLALVTVCLIVTQREATANYTHLWSQGFGDNTVQESLAVTVDRDNNVILTGYFAGTINFGGGDLVTTSATDWDVFVAKFGPLGNHIWSKDYGDDQTQYARCITTDRDRNIIVAGLFDGNMDFGGGSMPSARGDIFVAKLDASGNHQWSKRFGDSLNQVVKAVATDANGDVVLAGDFWGTVNFGGGGLASAGYADVFMAKFSSSGVYQWSKRFGVADNQQLFDMVADHSGNIILAGSFTQTIDFGGGVLTSAGLHDAYVAKFNSSGGHVWSRQFPGPNNSTSWSVAADPDNNVLVAGYYALSVDCGGGSMISAGGNDIFVAKLDAEGAHQWSQSFGDATYQWDPCIAVDANGNACITGYFWGSVNFGGGDLASAGLGDVYVACFDPGGAHRWSQSFGDVEDQQGEDVVIDGYQSIILAGHYEGSVSFGGGTLVDPGSRNAYVAKFAATATAVDRSLAAGPSLSVFPNPFNPATTIHCTIPSSGRVTIAIYDARGSRVAMLLDEPRPSGVLDIQWDGRSDAGEAVGSGVYFARLAHGGHERSYKMVLVK